MAMVSPRCRITVGELQDARRHSRGQVLWRLPLRQRRLPRSLPVKARTAPADPHRSLFAAARSEEHTSELQSHVNLVCRLLLEKKKESIINKNCSASFRFIGPSFISLGLASHISPRSAFPAI